MNVLRQAFESLRFSAVATFLGSGDIAFETRTKDVGTLERKIEPRLQRALGYDVPVSIRTPTELEEIAAFEPFEDSKILGTDVNIIYLTGNLGESSKAKLVALAEVLRVPFTIRSTDPIRNWSRDGRRVSLQLTIHGQLFRNGIREGLPTIYPR